MHILRPAVTFLSSLVLVCAAACGEVTDPGDDDDDVDVDASTGSDGSNGIDASGDIDASSDIDAGDGPARNLGLPCDANNPCPADEMCITLSVGSTVEGVCTIACNGSDDMTTCSDGYQGNGTPACALNDPDGNFFCGVFCEDIGGTGECHPELQCADSGQPGVGICVGDD